MISNHHQLDKWLPFGTFVLLSQPISCYKLGMIHLSSSTRSDLSYPPKKFNLSKEIIESLKTMKMELYCEARTYSYSRPPKKTTGWVKKTESDVLRTHITIFLNFWPRDSAKRSRSYKWQLLLCYLGTFVLIELYGAILLWISKSDPESEYWNKINCMAQYCFESVNLIRNRNTESTEFAESTGEH